MESHSREPYPRGEALIEAGELQALIVQGNSKLVVLQMVPAWVHWLHHIPNSLQVWRPDVEQPVGPNRPVPGMLLDAPEFEKWARGLGINNDSEVVVVDTLYDATRLWWAFYRYGKSDVRVLNGGLQAWRANGFPMRRGPTWNNQHPGNFCAKGGEGMATASMNDVRDAQTNPTLRLWDTREPEEWSGAKRKWGAKRAGRIPWSTFLSWKAFRHSGNEGSAFRSAAAISSTIASHGLDPAQRHIFYCQSGVRTTTAIFALYLMGWDPAHLVNNCGSWIEWSRDPANPIAVDSRSNRLNAGRATPPR